LHTTYSALLIIQALDLHATDNEQLTCAPVHTCIILLLSYPLCIHILSFKDLTNTCVCIHIHISASKGPQKTTICSIRTFRCYVWWWQYVYNHI